MPGKSVIKKSHKKNKEPLPNKSYRGTALDQEVKTKDMTYITVPGNVEAPVKMRLWDAKSRKLVTMEMYSNAMNVKEMKAFDLVTIVSEKEQKFIGGILEEIN